MKWKIFVPLAALVILATACERHPASELDGEHETSASGQGEGPQAPAGVPHNPAGGTPVAPLDEHTASEKAPAANASEGPSPKTSEPAPKFFPR